MVNKHSGYSSSHCIQFAIWASQRNNVVAYLSRMLQNNPTANQPTMIVRIIFAQYFVMESQISPSARKNQVKRLIPWSCWIFSTDPLLAASFFVKRPFFLLSALASAEMIYEFIVHIKNFYKTRTEPISIHGIMIHCFEWKHAFTIYPWSPTTALEQWRNVNKASAVYELLGLRL